MARRKTPPDSVLAKYTLAERLRQLRAELFGDRGGPGLARRLGIPIRTWYNYEAGVTVPAEVVLKIIELTSVEPMWLLHGKGPKYREAIRGRLRENIDPDRSVGALLRTALEILEEKGPGEEADDPASTFPNGSNPEATGAAQGYAPHGVAGRPGISGTISSAARDSATPGTADPASQNEWLDAQREGRCLRVRGSAMAPIVADGAYVAFARTEERPSELDGKMVVVWMESQPKIRWFQLCGQYALLRAENPAAEPQQFLVALDGSVPGLQFRRVLWINTPH